MADTLESTQNIFLKSEWGSASTSANNPSIWMTVGTSLNGSGTVGGVLVNRFNITCTASATLFSSYASVDTNRLQFVLWAGDNQNPQTFGSAAQSLFVSIERSKNASGADTAAGVYASYDGGAGGGGTNTMANLASLVAQSIPTIETYARVGINSTNTTMIAGNTAGVAIPTFFSPAPQYAGLGWFTGWAADFAKYSQLAVTLYGTSHNYIWLPIDNGVVGQANSILAGTGVVGMRYE